MIGTSLTDDMRLVLHWTSPDDACWTSDIAQACRRPGMTTYAAHRLLIKLERRGLVRRVAHGGRGNPTSWRRTEAGSAVLA